LPMLVDRSWAKLLYKLLSSMMSGTEPHTDREEDYRFLHSMLMEKKLHLLFKVNARLCCNDLVPLIINIRPRSSSLFQLAEELIYQGWREEVKELLALISKPHFQSLLHVHDAVAQRDFEPVLPPIPDDALEDEEDSVKIVSLVKTKEPLGATIKRDTSTGAIVVARIMRGGAADKSGLIHEGDELKEVNGVSLEHRKPKEILPLLVSLTCFLCSVAYIRFKIIPAYSREEMSTTKQKLFVRALFDYDPNQDPSIPCKDAALAFKRGDVLQIVSMEDDTWWQACHLEDSNGGAGLIPSKELHERSFSFTTKQMVLQWTGLRRSFRLGRKSSWAKEAARFRRWSAGVHSSICPPTYIKVIPYHREPKDRHRVVILVGPSGVGVNELKRRLLISDPDRYGVTVPHTTREKRRQESEGVDYHFVSVHMFEELILSHRFIEYGSYRGHYYGTSLDSVHRVMAEGKVCLLDAHPSKIKRVYTSEFKPYVVFVKPPRIEELRLTRRRAKFVCDEEDTNQVRIFSEADFEDMIDLAENMERQYGHLFDKVIVNGDIASAFRELRSDLEKIQEARVQWVPTEWSCSSPTKARRSCSHLPSWI
uniref:Membrane protein, palmitoylated 7b (MAGUK p55 subfamily member 7) n=1 Tax=Oreochromis aureus TaxID=47969 RepID=A0A668UPX2_OREAU